MADNEKTDEQKAAEAAAAAAPGPRSMVVPGNDLTGYIGVAPEYMNYANPTNKPYLTEEEAYLYTDLSNEQILGTRGRESEFENEKPAVAENTGYDFAADEGRRQAAEAEAEKDSGDTSTDGEPSGTGDQEQGETVPPPPTVVRPPLGS